MSTLGDGPFIPVLGSTMLATLGAMAGDGYASTTAMGVLGQFHRIDQSEPALVLKAS
jgi:hypothetical protein